MKANAPEKIYVEIRHPFGNEFTEMLGFEHRGNSDDIEYIRKDAFIEKACDAYCAICDTKECEGCAECSLVIKFRRQLEKL